MAVDDAEERVRGGEAERAERAAVEAGGGGRVVGVEREDEPGVAWEVDVVGRDGRGVEVELGAGLERVAVDAVMTARRTNARTQTMTRARIARETRTDGCALFLAARHRMGRR